MAMSEPATRAPLVNLTTESFRAYGRVIEAPPASPDATGPGWRWWGERHILECGGRPLGVGFLELSPAALQFDWAERHVRSSETILPLDGDCAVYVGSPAHADDPDSLPALEGFEVFLVRAGQGVILDQGVWHGAPLAIGGPVRAVVLLLEGTGTIDTTVVRFPDTPVKISSDRSQED
jgi:ureidoglycolate hydrolase